MQVKQVDHSPQDTKSTYVQSNIIKTRPHIKHKRHVWKYTGHYRSNTNSKKGKYMNSLDKYIYCTHRHRNRMNEVLFDLQIPIFDVMYNHYRN
jgi:hypothetical protein